ncbi:MAG: DJ-1 family glyoxalase III [Planctomycetota bacterium]
MTDKKPRVLVPIAHGTEEMEVTILVDVLRRAGIEVVLAGLDGADTVTCSRGLRITPDLALSQVRGDFDVIALPGGGEGSERFRNSAQLGVLLRAQEQAGRGLAAICAAPSAFAVHGVGKGAAMTAHPSVRETVAAHARWSEDSVVESGELVTSRGPGTAFAFALALVRRLCGSEVAAKVRAPMMFAD